MFTNFATACPRAVDFKKCSTCDEKMLHVLQMFPKLGVTRKGNKFKFFGYRQRLDKTGFL